MLNFSFSLYYFYLFPFSLIVFYTLKSINNKFALPFLALLSVFFLFLIDWRSFLLLCSLVLVNFLYIRLDYRMTLLQTFIILLNLLPLVLFKTETISYEEQPSLSMAFNILLPFGLAFYTLQQISAIIDTNKPDMKKMSFWQYVFFSFCFITVPAGPILTYKQAVSEYKQFSRDGIQYDEIAVGISLIIFGLAKFSLIALPMEQYLNFFFENVKSDVISLTFTESLYIMLGSLLKLYFSFSAYSDMAIGMGLCFGIKLPVNFDSPLKASTPTTYINSWHMSFMSFIREYVFTSIFSLSRRIPLKSIQTRYTAAWAIAVFFSFFLTAVWHSPSNTMIFQGALVALILVSIELFKKISAHKSSQSLTRLGGIVTRLIVLFSIFITGLFFFSPSFDIAVQLLQNVVFPKNISLSPRLCPLVEEFNWSLLSCSSFFPSLTTSQVISASWSPAWAILHIAFVTFIVFFMPNSMHIFNISRSIHPSLFQLDWKRKRVAAFIFALLFFISINMLTTEKGFLYG